MLFKWTAIDENSRLVHGDMDAGDKEQVVIYLKRQNYFVVSVSEVKPVSRISGAAAGLFFGKVSMVDKIVFTEHLAAMMKAGLSLNEAFNVLEEDVKNKILKKVILDLKLGLENGKTINSILSHYPNIFSNYYINMVRSGEETGDLASSLKRLTIYLRKDYALVSKIKGALAYPVVLLIATILVIILLVTFVLPKLVNLFSQSSVKLPLITKIILAISLFISKNFILFIVLNIFSFIAIMFLIKQKKVRYILSSFFLKIPKIKILVQNIQLARFSRTLSSTLSAGIPIIDSIELTADTLNIVYRKFLSSSTDKILKGVSLSKALKERPDLFPNVMMGMINVGEKTGNLSELLNDIADFYEEEVDNTLKEITTLIEPALLIFMGIGIGGIAISIIVPIYQLISKVG